MLDEEEVVVVEEVVENAAEKRPVDSAVEPVDHQTEDSIHWMPECVASIEDFRFP